MSKHPPRLREDVRGVTIVEFALLLPVLLALICGTIEFGHFYMANTSLEGALLEAARASSASQEASESTRDAAMRATVAKAMAAYQLAPGKSLTIKTVVYRNFSDSYPEPFVDKNGNGVYDGPSGNKAGEPFTDRNGNGKWDSAIPIPGTEGGPGDIVSYTANYPAAFLFGFVGGLIGRTELPLNATVVTRNEPVATK